MSYGFNFYTDTAMYLYIIMSDNRMNEWIHIIIISSCCTPTRWQMALLI